MRRNQVASGSEAFLQSTQIDLDNGCETARKKTVGGSRGGASLSIGSLREPLRLTLDISTLKKASLPVPQGVKLFEQLAQLA
jgi:hypothetical protein